MELRSGALEEAILPRLARGDHKSRETVALVEEFVDLREKLAAAADESPQALERLSVALAYQYDTLRGTDRQEALESRQVALDEYLHAAYPESLVFADNLCWTYQRVHHDIWMRGDRARSLDCLRKSCALGEEILKRHGRTPITLYTATSAAVYGAMASGSSGDLDGVVAGMQRARALGVELLRMKPDHYRGGSFLLRAGVAEAIEWIARGEPARAEAALSESRSLAAKVVGTERGVGFLGFTLAESWSWSAHAALLRGDPAGARLALDHLVAEVNAERAAIEREQLYAAYAAEQDLIRVRIALAEGRAGDARATLESVVFSLRRLPSNSADLAYSVDALVRHLSEMRADPFIVDFLGEVESLLARSEEVPDGTRRIRTSRAWFEFVRGDSVRMQAAIEAFRGHPLFHAASAYEAFLLERALRALESQRGS
jgi:hypothetical protein